MKNLIKEFIFFPPKHFYKNIFLNILGFQVFRLFYSNFKFFIMKTLFFQNLGLKDDISKQISENGYVIIKNFLPKKDFEKIIHYVSLLKKNNSFKKTKYGNAYVKIGPLNLGKELDPELNNSIFSIFDNSKIKDYAAKILCKKIKFLPSPVFQEINLLGSEDIDDVNSEFHVDRHFPCCKAFYYLNDNDEKNGAFIYMPGSHKLNFKRIKFEYLNSIFSTTNLFNKYLDIFGFKKKNSRITLKDELFESMFGEFKQCSAEANSLVICNNMGFHKRGKIKSYYSVRQHIRFSFYDHQINFLLLKLKNFLKKQMKYNN